MVMTIYIVIYILLVILSIFLYFTLSVIHNYIKDYYLWHKLVNLLFLLIYILLLVSFIYFATIKEWAAILIIPLFITGIYYILLGKKRVLCLNIKCFPAIWFYSLIITIFNPISSPLKKSNIVNYMDDSAFFWLILAGMISSIIIIRKKL